MSNPTTTGVLSPEERKKKYKKTLNLPRTRFPMRANLAQNEPQSRRRWEKERLFERAMEARRDAEPFSFHDGPPYANGSIHSGHLLNKVLKDIVVRSHTLAGHRCHYVPGWDCHGLPIEHKVMSDLIESGKHEKIEALEPTARHVTIRRECERYALKFYKIQAEEQQRLLLLADYDHPYLTLRPEYEQATLEVFAALVEQGLVYRDLKPVHWSIANRTALADAELEYKDREDPSIYVHFDAADAAAVAAVFGVERAAVEGTAVEGTGAPSFMIWTTTPWTLPANLLIAVHPQFTYALARLDGRLTVVARELLEAVSRAAGQAAEVLAEVRGEALLGLEYRHPFCDRRGRIVAADYVTLEDGTGLVHTAPGHGAEDFETGHREGLEAYCPVQDDGTFDATVPEWLRGRTVWEANPRVIGQLRQSGHLYHHQEFTHSYPHDWRSKTPVIFRCTEQWFVAVDKPTKRDGKSLRELALRVADEQISFVPEWGRNRFRSMLETRPDWCLSRQRSWGLPIPAFRRADGSVFLTTASARAVAERFGRQGSNAWFTEDPATLLGSYDPTADPEAPADLDLGELGKMFDIFDVWFESGSSWNAVMRARGLGYPVDLYLEGSDQHRGWFQLSLLPALGMTGQPAFKGMLTHGFVVDKHGHKMSKSLGNALDVNEVMEHYGADVCRWWVSSLAFENDVKVDLEFFDTAGESYRKVRNTLRFLLSNLDDFEPAAHAVELRSLAGTSVDAYILTRLAELARRVTEGYMAYEIRQVHLLLFDFCNETLSSFYLDAVKDRLYCDRPDSPRRRSCQTVLHTLADTLVVLLAPILPHTAEEAHRALHGDDADSVHLRTFPSFEDAPFEADAGWSEVLALREQVQKAVEEAKGRGIENRLDAGVAVADRSGNLGRFAADLPDVFAVSRVELRDGELAVIDLREEPRCERSWRRDPTVRERSDGGWLSDRDAAAVGLS